MPFVKVRGDGAITIPVELRRKHSVTPGTWYQVTTLSSLCCKMFTGHVLTKILPDSHPDFIKT